MNEGGNGCRLPDRWVAVFVEGNSLARIFSSLAVVAVVLIIGNLFLGLVAGDYNGGSARLRKHVERWELARRNRATDPAELVQLTAAMDAAKADFEPVRTRTAWHRLVGLLAALVGVLVQCIAVTYFIGTSRWCKEVVEAYGFQQDYLQRAAALKRNAFPWSLLGIVTIMTIVALGAAADPATYRTTTARWVIPHFWAAMLGTGVVAFCLIQQATKIHANLGLVTDVTAAVREERLRRGLDVEAPTTANT